ncbi:hypothetical protein [Mycobacterium pseudokansasii]|uniref:hypothetical protein n=1 Tax=Mycobacterium pseudokansasii TaxID=2341080 RepID=UPI0007B51D06|nr:hypothetical protein A4G27_22765 [Mycobacterium kansasii]VAZ92371.1 putative ABC transporter ATP-binding protein [Mycobacterium pseudokansasii]VAZ93477.1 putative ABC transporter ATP-binding protein [Mycobacterium pseudokansasii]
MTSTSAPLQGQLEDSREKPQSFTGSAIRLAQRLTPHAGLIAAVLAAALAGIALAVAGPRVLGHATDLLFNGVIGKRLPPGLTKEQAIAALRARGDNGFADLVSGMNVVPGQGIDFGAVARTLMVASGILASALLLWAKGRLLNVIVQRTILVLRADVEDTLYLRTRGSGYIMRRSHRCSAIHARPPTAAQAEIIGWLSTSCTGRRGRVRWPEPRAGRGLSSTRPRHRRRLHRIEPAVVFGGLSSTQGPGEG